MNLSYCSPNRQYKNANTCFSYNSLKKIADAYNKKMNTENKIIINDDINFLHKQLNKKLSKLCSNEICWANQSFVNKLNDDEINHLTFKPKRPDGTHTWLSTTDIRKVMMQYQKKYLEFIFLGPVPIDFDEINTEIGKLDLVELLNKGISKLGIVFNLDEHYKTGSHWVGMYMEFSEKRPEISFFDSYGEPPDKRINILMDRLIDSAKKDLHLNIHKKINKVRTQFANSECGVYSMNFILHNIMGDSFEDTTNNIISDDNMNKRRNLMFRTIE